MARDRSNPTERRRRKVRWAKRMRRFAMAWHNALEIARAGRLTAPYGAPFEVVHEEAMYRLRRYAHEPAGEVGASDALVRSAPLLLVPPLMIAAEVYDISPDISAVAYLSRAGIDVWLVDFGRPEDEAGGMDRTLDDHVRAVSEAIDRVRGIAGGDVHLAGYSQGGMFAYQAAALRRTAGVASIITFGSPVDLHRTLRVGEDATERLISGLRTALSWPLAQLPGLPGFLTSTGFKLLSARKEAVQLYDFVKHLHDREALEKREAKRLFLGGDGFVAWPGPAFRQFVDEVVVGNRMATGGFVIDGHTTSLADITCPIFYVIGDRDAMVRPASVRAIRQTCPKVPALHELVVQAGHFGLVVGSTALATTWPSVVAWLAWCAGRGAAPGTAIISAERPVPDDLGLARELVENTAKVVVDRISSWTEGLGSYVDSLRWQLPRLARLRKLDDDARISLGKALADQARDIGDRTFFLFRDRAFTYAEANRRVDAVVRGLVACGVRAGDAIGVMMRSRPSQLSVVTALDRLGAVAVLLSPATPDGLLGRALALGGAATLVVDPDCAARATAAFAGRVLVLGGAGEARQPTGPRRTLPAGVIDMEAIDPDSVALPAWYRPDAGRASELAMIFISASRHEPLRAVRVSHRRWALAAYGAAAAATLTTRDTVYCGVPLHHPTGMLVAAGSALVGGARLALATRLDTPEALSAEALWDEVRRYGVSVVYYAGEMCRRLVDAPPVLGEANNPVRLFAGSGLRRDVWRRLVDRFGPVGVLEMYASSEASVVLANARGKKLGSVGRPLPGSAEVAIAAWSFADEDFMRDGTGRLVHARLDEPGMLIARLPAERIAQSAQRGSYKIVTDAFAPGDRWLVTGDLFKVDAEGDYWFVDRSDHMIATRDGAIAPTRIEDALYAAGVALCIAATRPDPDDRACAVPVAAVVPHAARPIDADALSRAVASLPEHARPRRIRIVDAIAMTDGFRPIRRIADQLDFSDGPGVLVWDSAAGRYRTAASSTARTA